MFISRIEGLTMIYLLVAPKNGLYKIKIDRRHTPSANLGERVLLATWHARFGHSNERKIIRELVHNFELPMSIKKM